RRKLTRRHRAHAGVVSRARVGIGGPVQFTLLGSPFSVRVRVRFEVLGSGFGFGVRGSGFDSGRTRLSCRTTSPHRTVNGEPRSVNDRIAHAQEQLFAPGTSARQKYAALVVGRTGLGALLTYEFVVM